MDKRLESVESCPVCGFIGEFDSSVKNDEVDGIAEIRLYSCGNCNSFYQNPRMSEKAMKEYYSSGQYRETHKTSSAPEKDRAKRLISVLEMYKDIQPKRCLDIGSSHGWLLSLLKEKYDADVVGYDLYVELKAVIKPVTDRRKIKGKFDLITCIHTLEHFCNPIKELVWMAERLTENGVLLIEIPWTKEAVHPHPVIFSKEAVGLIMKHVGLSYDLLELAPYIGVIVARNGKKEVNTADFYDDAYLTKPSKWESVPRDAFALKSLSEFMVEPGDILDFGCGNGHTLAYFKSFWPSTKYTGIDISEIALKLAQRGIPEGKFYKSIPKGKFNIMLVMGVAEHFKDPAKQLKKLGVQLAKNGLLYLEVPNNPEPAGFRMSNGGQHEWHWKRETWEKAISEAGYKIVQNLQGNSREWEFVWILKKE